MVRVSSAFTSLALSVLAVLAPSSAGAVNVTDFILNAGYPLEEHHIPTTDGFVLSVQRIPHGVQGFHGSSQTRYENAGKRVGNATRPVVLLQHGLLDCAATWVCNGPTESLGFILADAGFDVWLGNTRGNTYSLENTEHKKDTEAFWAFTFDQMASPGDLASVIPYIVKYTGSESIGYVGHSQGTLEAFIAFSRDPGLAAQVNSFAALAPVAYVGHVPNLAIRALADIDLAEFLRIFGAKDFLPSSDVIVKAFPLLCSAVPHVCSDFLLYVMGWDSRDFNATRTPVYTSFDPAGTSVLNMLHYSQMIKSDAFRMFDWGKDGNEKHYGSATPPEYSLAAFPVEKVSLALFAGGRDTLADPRDVLRMREELPQGFDYHLYPDYGHLSFVWGTDAYVKVYPTVLEFLKNNARV